MNTEILTIPQAAKFCSVTRMTMWRWVKAGKIKSFVTPGGHHRIAKSDLEDALRGHGIKYISRQLDASPRILIVDDEPLIVQGLQKLFTRKKCEVQTALNGFEAGVKSKEFNPDLIILDLVMPKMDGFEVCRFLKSNESTSHIKILILTGYSTKENRAEIMEAGADAFIEKPADNKEIIQKTKELLKDMNWVRLNL